MEECAQGYNTDVTNSSFVFSLTNNDKFQLINPEKAICGINNNSNIRFGHNNLLICDRANVSNNS